MVDPDDDIRAFYHRASDGEHAFQYRLRQAVSRLGRTGVDYDGLLRALELMPVAQQMRVVYDARDDLLQLAAPQRPGGGDCASFMLSVQGLARGVGDAELATHTTCAFALSAFSSMLLIGEARTSAEHMLVHCRDDPSSPRDANARATLVLGELALGVGRLKHALQEARKALRLSDSPELAARSFLLVGDVDMARGAYGAASRNYGFARTRAASNDGHTRLVEVATRRWILAGLKSGSSTHDLSAGTEALTPVGLDAQEDVTHWLISLEAARHGGADTFVMSVAHMCDIIGRLSMHWRDSCRLSIGCAEALLDIGEHDAAFERLGYVLRLAGQHGNEAEAARATALLASACWRMARLDGALAAVRRARQLLRRCQSGATVGELYLTRALAAFYRGRTGDALRLCATALRLFGKACAWRGACKALEVIGAVVLWEGRFRESTQFLLGALELLATRGGMDRLAGTRALYCSAACWHSGAEAMQDTEVGLARRAARLLHKDLDTLLLHLLECDVKCMEGDGLCAVRHAETGVEGATALHHRPLEAIAHYQLVKALAIAEKMTEARRALTTARRNYPLGGQMMWAHMQNAIERGTTLPNGFKPFAAFPF